MKNTDSPPFFIIGVHRSGTTLLQVMLDQHSQIAVCPETNVFRVLDRLGAGRDIRRQWQYEELRRQLQERFEKYDDPAGQILEESFQVEPNYRGASRDLLFRWSTSYLQKKEKHIFGEKTPQNTFFLPLLQEICPQARFVFIVRHPLDVICSLSTAMAKSPVFANHSRLYLLLRAAEYVRRGWQSLADFEAFDKAICCLVVYENLIGQPAVELQRICDFLRVDFEPGMLHFYQQELFVNKNKVLKDALQGLQQPLSPKSIDRYKLDLNTAERTLLSTYLGQWPKALPYKKPALTNLSTTYRLALIRAQIRYFTRAFLWRETLIKLRSYARLFLWMR